MRKELFWDIDISRICPETEIERAINFGGFDYIREVQLKYGVDKFVKVLKNSRNLSKKAVNYWCMILKIERKETKTFQIETIWVPTR